MRTCERPYKIKTLYFMCQKYKKNVLSGILIQYFINLVSSFTCPIILLQFSQDHWRDQYLSNKKSNNFLFVE